MSFFEEVPIARILNTFARHQYILDETLTDAAFKVFLDYDGFKFL